MTKSTSAVLARLRCGYLAGMQRRIGSIPELRAAIGGDVTAQRTLAHDEAEAIRVSQSFVDNFSAVDMALSPSDLVNLEAFALTCGRWDATSPQVAAASHLVDRKLRQRGAHSGESDPEDDEAPTLSNARTTVSSHDIDFGLWNEAGRLLHANRLKQLLDLASVLEQLDDGDADAARRQPTHRAGDVAASTLVAADGSMARRA